MITGYKDQGETGEFLKLWKVMPPVCMNLVGTKPCTKDLDAVSLRFGLLFQYKVNQIPNKGTVRLYWVGENLC